jgi:CheY-like chemotaxis protein
MSTRLLIADDQALVRAGFRKILESEPGLTVVAEAEDGLGAVDAAARSRPDIALMDIRMPRLDGIAATRRIVERAADRPRVVMLTTYGLDAVRLRGAAGRRKRLSGQRRPAQRARRRRQTGRRRGGAPRPVHHARGDRGIRAPRTGRAKSRKPSSTSSPSASSKR